MSGIGVGLMCAAKRGVAVFESTLQHPTMAKEINTESSPGIFQLFNENRTFFFESDISSLPNPPCTLAGSPATHTSPSLASRWSHSARPHSAHTQTQSHRNRHHSAEVSVAGSTISSTDLRLPASIMASTAAPTPPTTPTHHHQGSEHKTHHRSHSEVRSQAVAAAGAVEGPYRETHLGDGSILRSFHQGVAGASPNRSAPQQIPSQPLSASTPGLSRSISSPTLPISPLAAMQASDASISASVAAAQSCESGLDLPERRQRANSDPRKLSLVMEEEGAKSLSAALDSNPGAVVVKASGESEIVAKFYQGQSDGESSASPSPEARKRQQPFGSMLRGGEMNLSRRMADWFMATQPHAQVSRKELNAISPQSF